MEQDIDDILEADAIPTDSGDGQELWEHYRFVAEKGQNLLRVDKFLVSHIDNTSRNRIQQAAEANCILANGKAVKSNYRVKPGDIISLVMDRPRYELDIIPEDIPLDIVYEDDQLLVVNKPAGLVVHPGHGNYSGTLVNALAYHFRNDPDYDVSDPRLGLVHRIDKDTSGLLVIAKTPDAKTFLGKQFFNKTTHRQYVALVWGKFTEDHGTVEGNIGRNPKDRLQMAVFPEGDQGKHAVTHYKVIENLSHVAVVQCQLETGRTPDTCAHEAYRTPSLQRRSLRRRQNNQRHHGCKVHPVCTKLLQNLSASGSPRQNAWLRTPPHTRRNVLQQRDSSRYDRTHKKMGRLYSRSAIN